MNKQITVFVGVLVKDNKILLNQRYEPEVENAHLMWELPGGKCEFRETPEEAIIREFREETGVEISVKRIIPFIFAHNWEYEWGIQQTFLIGFECTFVKQHKQTPDHHVKDVKWIEFSKLSELNLIAGSREFIEATLRS